MPEGNENPQENQLENNENQEVELKTSTGQVYKGATLEEAAQQVIKAQESATATIRDMRQELLTLKEKLISQQPPPAPAQNLFEKQKYYKLLEDDPLAAQDYIDNYRPTVHRVLNAVDKLEQGLQAQEFIRRTPEYNDTAENSAAMFDWLKENNRVATADNMQIAYISLAQQGKIKAGANANPNTGFTREPNPTMGGNSPSGSDVSTTDFENMTIEQMEAFFRKKGMM